MKIFKSTLMVFLLLASLFMGSVLISSDIFVLNKTGASIYIEAKGVPKGLLWATTKKVTAEPNEGYKFPFYRAKELRIRNSKKEIEEVITVKVDKSGREIRSAVKRDVVSRIIGVGDPRLAKSLKYEGKVIERRKGNLEAIGGAELRKGTLKIKQKMLTNVLLPLRFIVTRHSNGHDFYVTEVFGQWFGKGKFLSAAKEAILEELIPSLKKKLAKA